MNYVSFPKLGLSFAMRESISILGFNIYWYAIIIAFGMLCAIAIAYSEFKKRGTDTDILADFVLFAIPIGILGARAYYVIFEWSYYRIHPDKIIAVWEGGLAIYGGIIAGCIVAVIFAKVRKIPFLWFADIATIGLFIAQSIGRWGNFVNAEAFGGLTELPWGMVVDGPNVSGAPFGPCHPTFLYESLWNMTGFIISYFFIHKRCSKDGASLSFYLIWYGTGRFFIEGLRTDSLYLVPNVIRVSQVVAAVSVIAGIILAYRIKTEKRASK